jgi:phospholipase/carboxylesterase
VALQDLAHLVREPARDPEGAIVLMHGRGVDEADLFPLVDAIDPDRRLVGLTPRAPHTPAGHSGNHWYVVQRVGFPDPVTFHQTYSLLSAWIDAISPELGVPIDRTVLGGFSQGGVMAYATGLGAGRPSPAGILALSSFIPTVERWEPDLDSRPGLPVLIAHGSLDPVIEVRFGRAASERLAEAGLDVTYRESPVGHTLAPEAVDLARGWLASALP